MRVAGPRKQGRAVWSIGVLVLCALLPGFFVTEAFDLDGLHDEDELDVLCETALGAMHVPTPNALRAAAGPARGAALEVAVRRWLTAATPCLDRAPGARMRQPHSVRPHGARPLRRAPAPPPSADPV
jgi:hypothetical protein